MFILTKAVELDRCENVRLLLEDGQVKPVSENSEALRVAAIFGYDQIVELLLADRRVDPTALDDDTLITIVENNYENVVKLLLIDRRTNIDDELLIIAARFCHDKIFF